MLRAGKLYIISLIHILASARARSGSAIAESLIPSHYYKLFNDGSDNEREAFGFSLLSFFSAELISIYLRRVTLMRTVGESGSQCIFRLPRLR